MRPSKIFSCNSTYRLRYWNPLSSLPPTVNFFSPLQQYLPLAVLKPVYLMFLKSIKDVATVLTACGIETLLRLLLLLRLLRMLQQYLPLAVLKLSHSYNNYFTPIFRLLQQYLPLAVLKPVSFTWITAELNRSSCNSTYRLRYWNVCCFEFSFYFSPLVATVLTACGIETLLDCAQLSLLVFEVATVLTACGIETFFKLRFLPFERVCCNSTYRLRYWNQRAL